jgi:hypothetical protein
MTVQYTFLPNTVEKRGKRERECKYNGGEECVQGTLYTWMELSY